MATNKREHANKKEQPNRREHFRVDFDATIIIRYVPKGRLSEIAAEIKESIKVNSLASNNKVIVEAISAEKGRSLRHAQLYQALNDKMDFILNLVRESLDPSAKIQPINISAGGCRFFTDQAIGPGEIVDITVRFSDHSEIRGLSRVVRNNKIIENDFGSYEMAVQFKSLVNAHREILDRKIMTHQREQKREIE